MTSKSYKILFEKSKKCLIKLESLICTWEAGNSDLFRRYANEACLFVKEIYEIDDLEVFISCNKCSNCLISSFVQTCLFICNKFNEIFQFSENNEEYKSIKKAPDFLLSIPQKNKLFIIFRFVLHQGIVRHFRFGPTFKLRNLQQSDICSIKQFCFTSKFVLEKMTSSIMKQILFKKFLYEVIGCLMQICFDDVSRPHIPDSTFSWVKSYFENDLHLQVNIQEISKCVLMLQGSTHCSSPRWLRDACGSVLTRLVSLSNGMISVSSSIIEMLDGKLINEENSSKIISKILTTFPRSSSNLYQQSICHQLYLHIQNDSLFEKRHLKSTTILCHVIISSYLLLIHKTVQSALLLLQPILHPFQLATDMSRLSEQPVLMTSSLQILHRLFCVIRHPLQKELARDVIAPYIIVVFTAFRRCLNSTSFLKRLLVELMVAFLRLLSTQQSVALMTSLAGVCDIDDVTIHRSDGSLVKFHQLKRNLQMDGSDVIITIATPPSITCIEQLLEDDVINAIAKLLDDVKELRAEMLTSLISNLRNFQVDNLDDLKRSRARLSNLALISLMCEKYDADDIIEDDIEKICDVIKVFLHRAVEESLMTSTNETLMTSLAILGICLMKDFDEKNVLHLQKLLPLLQKVTEKFLMTSQVGEIAFDLISLISTKNISSQIEISKLSAGMQKHLKLFEESKTPKRKKIEILHSPKQKRDRKVLFTSIDESLKCFQASEAYIRAAALRHVTKLLKLRDASVLKHYQQIYTLVMASLPQETDSFVYLSSFQLLAEIILLHPNLTDNKSFLETLIEKMKSLLTTKDPEDEVFMKFSEVLSRVINQLGQMSAHYSKQLIQLIFFGCRNNSLKIQTSSLSIFSNLLPLIPHQISSHQYELTECLCSLMKGETPEVRRAAIHVIRSIVEKLGCDVIEMIPDVLKRWKDDLKMRYKVESDQVTKLQCQLALESIDAMKKETMARFHDQPISKHIVVIPNDF